MAHVRVRYSRDVRGLPRAEVAPPHEVLGWFPEQDVQGNTAWCQRLLQRIDDVQRGRMPS
jgi:hypothetical protein